MSRPGLTALLPALVIIGLSGCTNGPRRISIYDAEGIDAIKSWYVGFAYEAGRYEEVIDTVQGGEMRVIKDGYPPMDLQLRDDILFRLRDAFPIRTVRIKSQAQGFVHLAPLHFSRGHFKSVDVTILPQDQSRELARIRINNGQSGPAITDNEKFAIRCADQIGKVISEPYLQ